jgi:N-methylhydantoinase A
MQHPHCRIGIDVGGTFTDFVLADRITGRLVRYKEPSVPADPSQSVERGLPPLIERAGVAPSEIELVVHGTTLALNAIIQRRGAKLGLVVSRGNRGVLEIGRAQLPNAFSFLLQKETPLVPRSLVLEVSARLDRYGAIVADATDAELDAIAGTFAAAKVDAVTVMLLHAYARPEFEADIASALRRRLPGLAITPSAAIWPERREYERCLVALMNAYIEPMMTDYLTRLSQRIRRLGIDAPVYITSNNGGTLSIDTARQRPIDTILSGPASGVVAAAAVASHTPHRNLITVDMGGTSADMSVVQELEPAHTTRTTVGNLPIIVPVVSVTAIGAGGGSIVWVDGQGMLKVGPHSAGAQPGPACYAAGGIEPTVTDCYVVAGYIDPAHFLGGRLALDGAAARRALETVADALGVAGEERSERVALSALRIATASMASEIGRDLAQKGEDARDYALIAFGGAGPTQALHLAEEVGISCVIVPAAPSTFCALGAILADVKRDFVASRFVNLADGPAALDELSRQYERLETIAAEWIAAEGDILGATRFEATADLRYAGQTFDLQVRLPEALRRRPDAAAISELFHQAHEKIYSFRDPDSPVEITAERLRVVGTIPPIDLPAIVAGAPSAGSDTRRIYLESGWQTASVWQRDQLAEGATIPGPAIIEQEDTTTLIRPDWTATVDRIGNIIATTSQRSPTSPG